MLFKRVKLYKTLLKEDFSQECMWCSSIIGRNLSRSSVSQIVRLQNITNRCIAPTKISLKGTQMAKKMLEITLFHETNELIFVHHSVQNVDRFRTFVLFVYLSFLRTRWPTKMHNLPAIKIGTDSQWKLNSGRTVTYDGVVSVLLKITVHVNDLL